jgi:hypothetical protein
MIAAMLALLLAGSEVSSPLALEASILNGHVLEVRVVGTSKVPVLSTRRTYLGAHISVEVRDLRTGRGGYLGPRYLMATPTPEDFSLVTQNEFFGRRFDLRQPGIIRYSTGEEGSFSPGESYELLVTYRDGESRKTLTPVQRKRLRTRFGDFVELEQELRTTLIQVVLAR